MKLALSEDYLWRNVLGAAWQCSNEASTSAQDPQHTAHLSNYLPSPLNTTINPNYIYISGPYRAVNTLRLSYNKKAM